MLDSRCAVQTANILLARDGKAKVAGVLPHCSRLRLHLHAFALAPCGYQQQHACTAVQKEAHSCDNHPVCSRRLHADVGLAKMLTREKTMVSTEGTFDWSSPEVLAGQQCSEAADLWSLGVVLWEICTGECRPNDESCASCSPLLSGG